MLPPTRTEGKINYLNPAFFTIRIFIYFGLWMLWSNKLRKWSLEEDETRVARSISRW